MFQFLWYVSNLVHLLLFQKQQMLFQKLLLFCNSCINNLVFECFQLMRRVDFKLVYQSMLLPFIIKKCIHLSKNNYIIQMRKTMIYWCPIEKFVMETPLIKLSLVPVPKFWHAMLLSWWDHLQLQSNIYISI